MALVEVLLPSMGEGIIEATLISWLKNEGDDIAVDENLIEVATDKVNSEVPSTISGKLHEKLFQDNDVIEVGKPFALIATESDETPTAPKNENPKKSLKEEFKVESIVKKEVGKIEKSIDEHVKTVSNSSERFYSPLVLNIARKEGISQSQLDSIDGSGHSGRVTKDDILEYLQNGEIEKRAEVKASNIQVSNSEKTANTEALLEEASVDFGPNVEVYKMDRMRKLIAGHMVHSIQTSPHVCSFVEADMTNIVSWRNKVKAEFQEKYGVKLTFTPILIEAIAKTLVQFPMINSSLEGDNILVKKDINIGMAAALPDGNLIVPVIKNADMLNLLGLAKMVNDLGQRAKKNQLKPDEISGGTYTMTNLGSFGNLFGTPIINQPQVAIMGVGAIVKKPVVIRCEDEDTIAIRSMMYLSHSYDHRVVDGMLGGTFVKKLAETLESFDINRGI